MANTYALSLLASNASLPKYLAEINKFPMLDADKEYMLAKRYRETGDIEAAHELTTSHLRLAAKVAISFRHYGLALSDLISVAEEEMLKAGETLLESDQENRFLYVVLSGLLEMQENKTPIQEFGPRQIIAETTVFSPAPLPGIITAKKKTILLRISADQLYRIMALHPTLAFSFLEELSRRVRLNEKKD